MDEEVNFDFMSGDKLNQLFQAARRANAPTPSPTFADDVVRVLRREPNAGAPGRLSLWDELNAGFPRLVVAALVVLALGVAANLALGTVDWKDLRDGVAQLSTQDILPLNGF
jgi:hypothetical protein